MPETPELSPSSALAHFEVVAGPRNGEELPVLAPVISIGQGPQNDLVLSDDSVSRTHARLEYKMGSWLLTDLESTNGTLVEGVRLAPGVPTPLANAASVRFGGVRVQFREAPEIDPSSPQASFRPPTGDRPQRKKNFRLPLWLFLLILVLVAVAVFLLVGGLSATQVAEMEVVVREVIPPARSAAAAIL
jgi:hypothetical protein